jgi:poly(beta-D-mannuronate) lyase
MNCPPKANRVRQRGVVLFHAAVWLAATCSTSLADSGRCATDAPVVVIKGVEAYIDKKASIVDPLKGAEHAALLRPISMFSYHLAEATDAVPLESGNARCAIGLLRAWADAGALTQAPDYVGVRERARFVIGFNLTVLKLRSGGYDVDDKTLQWLHELTRASVAGFPVRSAIANLDVWSGVDAATFLLLGPDDDLKAHALAEWRGGIGQIASDGSLGSEMKRGQRALLYHQYYLSGLLMLAAMLPAIGYALPEDDVSALRRLGQYVATSLCQPTDIETRAGIHQEMPPPYQFSVLGAFGGDYVSGGWRACVKLPATLRDDGVGGDMLIVRDVIKRR